MFNSQPLDTVLVPSLGTMGGLRQEEHPVYKKNSMNLIKTNSQDTKGL